MVAGPSDVHASTSSDIFSGNFPSRSASTCADINSTATINILSTAAGGMTASRSDISYPSKSASTSANMYSAPATKLINRYVRPTPKPPAKVLPSISASTTVMINNRTRSATAANAHSGSARSTSARAYGIPSARIHLGSPPNTYRRTSAGISDETNSNTSDTDNQLMMELRSLEIMNRDLRAATNFPIQMPNPYNDVIDYDDLFNTDPSSDEENR